jgi:DNA gyrase subunit A
MVALANIDEIIELIKKSPSPADARAALCAKLWRPGAVTAMLERAGALATRPDDLVEESGITNGQYRLSTAQAQAILDLRLQRLTGLEQDKISSEYGELIASIQAFLDILANPDRLQEVIRSELSEVRAAYADRRRTEIVENYDDLTVEDLIPEETVVVTLSHAGYAKSQPAEVYQAQRRGGRGRTAARVRDEDFIDQLFVANSHDTVLCFSSRGKAYWLRVYQVPQAAPGARGRPIVNLLPLEEGERITTVLPVKAFEEDKFVFLATKHGTVKKTPLAAFARQRTSGIIAVELRDDDRLIGAGITTGNQDIMLFASSGKAIRFSEQDVRPMGRTAAGVRGLKLAGETDEVIGLSIIGAGPIMTATENGYGKLTPIDEHPVQGRGGQGVICIQTSERNGRLVGALQVAPEDEVMLITSTGTMIRTPVSDISTMSRNTQGVRLIRLDETQTDRLVGISRVEPMAGDDAAAAE